MKAGREAYPHPVTAGDICSSHSTWLFCLGPKQKLQSWSIPSSLPSLCANARLRLPRPRPPSWASTRSPMTCGRCKPLFGNILAAGLPVSDNCSAIGSQPELPSGVPQHLSPLPSAWRGAFKHRLQATIEKPTLPFKPTFRIKKKKTPQPLSTIPISLPRTVQRCCKLWGIFSPVVSNPPCSSLPFQAQDPILGKRLSPISEQLSQETRTKPLGFEHCKSIAGANAEACRNALGCSWPWEELAATHSGEVPAASIAHSPSPKAGRNCSHMCRRRKDQHN